MKNLIIISFIAVLIYSALVTAFILIAPSKQSVKDFFTFENHASNLDWRFI